MTEWPLYRARVQLAFGEWLRRRRRMAGSRSPLRAARDAFDALGVDGWRGRARQELRASGESSAIAIHHLFSYEIDLRSPVSARAIFSMEDWLIRPDDEPLVHDPQADTEPFRTMHGYGHYHGAYELIDDTWFIAELTQTRLKLDFT